MKVDNLRGLEKRSEKSIMFLTFLPLDATFTEEGREGALQGRGI